MVNATPRPFYTRERELLRIAQEAGWAPGTSLDGSGKSLLLRGLIPLTVQPVASRCTDWAIAAHKPGKRMKVLNSAADAVRYY